MLKIPLNAFKCLSGLDHESLSTFFRFTQNLLSVLDPGSFIASDITPPFKAWQATVIHTQKLMHSHQFLCILCACQDSNPERLGRNQE